ncbi:hypothetical protein D3C76_1494630 [compost metagenome]
MSAEIFFAATRHTLAVKGTALHNPVLRLHSKYGGNSQMLLKIEEASAAEGSVV